MVSSWNCGSRKLEIRLVQLFNDTWVARWISEELNLHKS